MPGVGVVPGAAGGAGGAAGVVVWPPAAGVGAVVRVVVGGVDLGRCFGLAGLVAAVALEAEPPADRRTASALSRVA